jgi:acetylornithine deacetylase/succinyl-diaminopimelate desuccinylase-like protein
VQGLHRAYLGSHYLAQGVGLEFLLKHGTRADYAILAKPGYAVIWEEVGLCWFRIRVKGDMCYVGLRHICVDRNPIVLAARVIDGIELWAREYAAQNAGGQVAPQAAIGAIEAGWPYKPSMTPAICDLYMDVRTRPEANVLDVRDQVGAMLARLQETVPGLELEWEMYLGIPGSRTDPSNWIIQTCTRAWEAVEGKPHVPMQGMSAATDGVILRTWGIPTARLGAKALYVPVAGKPTVAEADHCSVENLVHLARCYAYAIVDTCTRTREEVRARQERASLTAS